jgi:hypothetical protein
VGVCVPSNSPSPFCTHPSIHCRLHTNLYTSRMRLSVKALGRECATAFGAFPASDTTGFCVVAVLAGGACRPRETPSPVQRWPTALSCQNACAAIDAPHLKTGWALRPRVYGCEMITCSISPQWPITPSKARKPISEQKSLHSAVGPSGPASLIGTQLSIFWPTETTVPRLYPYAWHITSRDANLARPK